MKLEDYLEATKKIALEEKEILDELSQKNSLSPIEKRAVKNSLIHDYLEFDEAVMIDILQKQKYLVVFDFLIEDVAYSSVVVKRIESFSF